jgi:molybdopterin-guanine dinucleotide biosynthesis protein A
MGVDKGLLREIRDDGTTPAWTRIALDKLARVSDGVAVSIRGEQRPSYTRELPEFELIEDTHVAPGPMGALLSVFEAKRQDLLVLAVDMPDINVAILERLTRERGPDHDAVLFRGAHGLEPLCALYGASGLDKLSVAVSEARNHGYSLQQIPDFMNVRELELDGATAACFRNINSAGDMR